MRESLVQLDQLEHDIGSLRIEFERFFNGDLDLPPEDLRFQIKTRINTIRGIARGVLAGFRLTNLEARFHSYSELIDRRLRRLEEQGAFRAHSAPPVKANSSWIFGETLTPSGVAPLYQRLYSHGPRQRPVDLQSFVTYLERQHASIRERTGCSKVCFRIVEEDGKTKLKARPVRETESLRQESQLQS